MSEPIAEQIVESKELEEGNQQTPDSLIPQLAALVSRRRLHRRRKRTNPQAIAHKNKLKKNKRHARWVAHLMETGEVGKRKQLIQDYETAVTKHKAAVEEKGKVESTENRQELIARDVRDILINKTVSAEVSEAVEAINESYAGGKDQPLAKILGGTSGVHLIVGRDPVQAELALRTLGCRNIDELSAKCNFFAKMDTNKELKNLADEATKAQITNDLIDALKLAKRCQNIYRCIADNFFFEDWDASRGLTKDQVVQFFSVELDLTDTREDKMRRGKLKVEIFGQWINGLSQALADLKDFPVGQICSAKAAAFVMPVGRIAEQFRLARLDLGLRGLSMDKNGSITMVTEESAKRESMRIMEEVLAKGYDSRTSPEPDPEPKPEPKPEPQPDDTQMGTEEKPVEKAKEEGAELDILV